MEKHPPQTILAIAFLRLLVETPRREKGDSAPTLCGSSGNAGGGECSGGVKEK